MYIIALVQIDQKISEGIRVEGWVKETGGIVKRAGGTNDPVNVTLLLHVVAHPLGLWCSVTMLQASFCPLY